MPCIGHQNRWTYTWATAYSSFCRSLPKPLLFLSLRFAGVCRVEGGLAAICTPARGRHVVRQLCALHHRQGTVAGRPPRRDAHTCMRAVACGILQASTRHHPELNCPHLPPNVQHSIDTHTQWHARDDLVQHIHTPHTFARPSQLMLREVVSRVVAHHGLLPLFTSPLSQLLEEDDVVATRVSLRDACAEIQLVAGGHADFGMIQLIAPKQSFMYTCLSTPYVLSLPSPMPS